MADLKNDRSVFIDGLEGTVLGVFVKSFCPPIYGFEVEKNISSLPNLRHTIRLAAATRRASPTCLVLTSHLGLATEYQGDETCERSF